MTVQLQIRRVALLGALSITLLLAACGGGGGGSTSTASTSSTSSSSTGTAATGIPAGTTQTASTYAPGSVQAAMFAQINAYRQTCGFPAVQQNTLLDQAAQNHAQYMVLNGDQTTDTETQGNPGFTGVDYTARAVHVGWPASLGVGGGADGWYNYNALTPSQMGQALVNSWASGVYHDVVMTSPYTLMGFGVAQTQSNGYPLALASESDFIDGATPNDISASVAPLTFPCQGVTGVPYGDAAEGPMPPNVSASGFGTPVSVVGPIGSTVMLTSASMVNTANGQQVTLNMLNSGSDPNHELQSYQASAYPAAPLSPNTTYQVNLNGTINGKAFSRSFTFTTSNVLA